MVRRLVDGLAQVMKRESIGGRMATPNQAFEGLKPLEVVERGEADRLWAMIHHLRSGEPV